MDTESPRRRAEDAEAGTQVRAYRESDLERLRELHRKQGFEYPFPDLDDPVFCVGAIAEDGIGLPQAAGFLKVHAEAYLLFNPEFGTPQQRWQTLLAIHENVRQNALRMGFDSVTAYIPTGLPRAFKRRLVRLGWGKDLWESYSYRVRPPIGK